jgi:glutathione peroxidase
MTLLCFITLLLGLTSYPVLGEDCPATLYFSFRTLAGERQESLCEHYAGKVLLVVNTASYCGFTPQYEGLEMLYDRYRERGFVELA